MAIHVLKVKQRINGNIFVVVIGCDVCGWEGAMSPYYERTVLSSTAKCPGTNDPTSAFKTLVESMEADQQITIPLWDNCFSWQEALCGPLPAFREMPPGSPPDLPPELTDIIGPIVAIKLGGRGEWTVWTKTEIYYSHHSSKGYVTIQPPDCSIRFA